jgi:hypothetical protein
MAGATWQGGCWRSTWRGQQKQVGANGLSGDFTAMLQSWHNYYFMTGGAAATLIGLMFVALSLGMNLVNETPREAIHTFVTPSIVYFVSVLLICCIMLAPIYTPVGLGVVLLIFGVVGFAINTPYFWQLFQAARIHRDFDVRDWLFQLLLPPIAYALIIGAGVCLLADQWSPALIALWLVIILLLVCAIANTWGMVVWIISQRNSAW